MTKVGDGVEDIEIHLLLEALFRRYHYDFRNYTRASIKRRLKQACPQLGFHSFSALQDAVLHDRTMVPRLLDYLTVQVSEMFRDPSYFRAIREQGRDRVADLFLWRGGELVFYRGHTAPHVEFPLELELPALILAGLETAKPGDAILDEHRASLDRVLGAVASRAKYDSVTWPPAVLRVLELTRRPVTLRDVLTTAARSGGVLATGDVLRGIEILVAAGLLAWRG